MNPGELKIRANPLLLLNPRSIKPTFTSMTKLSTRSRTDLIVHIGIMLALSVVLILTFFFGYLPFSTNHGQTITVPDLKHMSLDELRN